MRTEAERERQRRHRRGKRQRDRERREWENHVLKMHYLTKHAADIAALYTMYQPGDCIPIHAYECPLCGWWIIGHDLVTT